MMISIRNQSAWGSPLALFVGAVCLGRSGAIADPFAYNPKDLLLCFRQAGGANELEVDLGPATNYAGLAPGAEIAVTALDTNRLALAFATLNNLSWSVDGTQHKPADTNFPFNTLWLTRARPDASEASTPWLRETSALFASPSSKIDTMGTLAVTYSITSPGAISWTNTVILPAGNRDSYGYWVGAFGNFGAWPDTVEATTPADFATAGNPVWADLYQLLPGSAADGTLNTPGTLLGYFTLQPDGTLTFTAAGGVTPPPQPQIAAILRTNGITQVSFATVTNATYSLLGVAGAGLATAVTNWPVVGVSVPGTGGTMTLPDPSSDAARFYSVCVTRP